MLKIGLYKYMYKGILEEENKHKTFSFILKIKRPLKLNDSIQYCLNFNANKPTHRPRALNT